MTKEQKIEIIIVNLYRNILKITDEKILLKIYSGVKKMDTDKKNLLIKELIEKNNKKKNIYIKGKKNISDAKNKISEKIEISNEKVDIDNLVIN